MDESVTLLIEKRKAAFSSDFEMTYLDFLPNSSRVANTKFQQILFRKWKDIESVSLVTVQQPHARDKMEKWSRSEPK